MITVTVVAGANYTGASNSDTVNVTDDDDTPPPAPTAPLEITRVNVPTAWTVDDDNEPTNARLDITIDGYVNQTAFKEFDPTSLDLLLFFSGGSELFHNGSSTNLMETTISDDGMIRGNIVLNTTNTHHEPLAGETVTFKLQVWNVTATSYHQSDDAPGQHMIPALPTALSETSVDMTTTPVSGNTAGFPPITRAVINDVSAIPGIHNVVHSSSDAAHTFVNYDDDVNMENDEVTVEDFSDRLRITVDHDIGIDMPTMSKLVIKHWDLSMWKNLNDTHGVRTLFNWDFDSIPNTNVGNIVIANASNHTQHVVLATGSDSSPHDITSMVDEIAELGHDTDLIIHLSVKPEESNHLCSDITLVADFSDSVKPRMRGSMMPFIVLKSKSQLRTVQCLKVH